jgi:hypothetical protein
VLKFKSTNVEVAGLGKLKVTGDLTINAYPPGDSRGGWAYVADPGHSGAGKNRLECVDKDQPKRVRNPLQPVMETGGVAVSDEVSINLEIELIRNQNRAVPAGAVAKRYLSNYRMGDTRCEYRLPYFTFALPPPKSSSPSG